MTATLDTDRRRPRRLHGVRRSSPSRRHGPAYVDHGRRTFAGRTLRQFVRTPQLIVVGALTSTMFLLIFRYVFGGAIGTGVVAYVDFLIPGLAAAGAMFSGTGGAVGVAEDVESGLFDRLRSLPIPRSAVLLGRSLADTALVAWGAVRHGRRRLRHRLPLPRVGARRRRRGGAVPRSSARPSRGRSSTWASSPATPRPPTACRSWPSRSCSCPAPTCRSSRCPAGCSRSPSTSRSRRWSARCARCRSATRRATVLGHSAGWFAVRALVWSVAIVAVFAPLATRRFARR